MSKHFLNINKKFYEVHEEVYIYVKQLENLRGWDESKKELVEFKQEYMCQFTDIKNYETKTKHRNI